MKRGPKVWARGQKISILKCFNTLDAEGYWFFQAWTQSASNRGNLGGLRREYADASQNDPMVLNYHLYSWWLGGRGVAWIKAPGLIKTANLGGLAIFFSWIQVCWFPTFCVGKFVCREKGWTLFRIYASVAHTLLSSLYVDCESLYVFLICLKQYSQLLEVRGEGSCWRFVLKIRKPIAHAKSE